MNQAHVVTRKQWLGKAGYTQKQIEKLAEKTERDGKHFPWAYAPWEVVGNNSVSRKAWTKHMYYKKVMIGCFYSNAYSVVDVHLRNKRVEAKT